MNQPVPQHYPTLRQSGRLLKHLTSPPPPPPNNRQLENLEIRHLFFFSECPNRHCGPPSFLSVVTGSSKPRKKLRRPEVDHLYPSRPRLRVSGFTLTCPPYAVMVVLGQFYPLRTLSVLFMKRRMKGA